MLQPNKKEVQAPVHYTRWPKVTWWPELGLMEAMTFNTIQWENFSFHFYQSTLTPYFFYPFSSFSPLILFFFSLMGLPDSWFHRHVFANNRLLNTDHSILCCPNISDCFHIKLESLETPQYLLFMVTINYSPWYELQSRKAKLETVER